MLISTRRERQEQNGNTGTAGRGGDGNDNDEASLPNVLAQLIADGTVVLQDDNEEDDPDYQMEEEEDDDEEIDEMDDDDDDEETYGHHHVHHAPHHHNWFEEVKEPKPEGMALLFSGEFGRIKHQIRSRSKAGNVSKILLRNRNRVRPTAREDVASVCPVIRITALA